MIDLTTYALLRKQIATAASGISDVRAEGDELVFVLVDGHEVRMAIPATEIRDAVVRDDMLVLTLKDDKEVVVDTTLTQSGQAADAKATGDALALKLTEPSSGLAVGKYFRIAAIDENGHAVLEAVDLPSAPVQDVLVNGASIVADGVANVPIAGSAGSYGVIRGNVDYGYYIGNGAFACENYTAEQLSSKRVSSFVGKGSLFNLLSTPSKMPALTEAEQAAARERMGIDKPYELIEESTLEEDAVYIVRNAEPDGTTYNFRKLICIVELPNGNVDRNIGWRYAVNNHNMLTYWLNAKSQYALYMSFYADVIGNRLFCRSSLARTSEFGGSNIGDQPKSVSELGYYAANAITSIRVKEANGVGYPAGAIIKIYGVRA